MIEREGAVVAVRRRPADLRLLLFYLRRKERREADAATRAAQARIPPDSSSVSKLRAEIRALAGLSPTGDSIPPASDLPISGDE